MQGRRKWFASTLEDIDHYKFRVMSKQGLRVENQKMLKSQNLMKFTGKRMHRYEKMFNAERVAHSQRYFKRASNQLTHQGVAALVKLSK